MIGKRRNRGFSLLEVSMAISLCMVGGLGAMHLYGLVVTHTRSVHDSFRATQVLEHEIESLRSRTLPETSESFAIESDHPALDYLPAARLSASITPRDATLAEVEVRIAWPARHGIRLREASLVTLMRLPEDAP